MAGAAIELTADNFDEQVLKSDRPVLVDFWAPWCGPCKMIGPLIDQLATEQSDRFRIGKLNVDEAQSLAMRYGVNSIPTLLVFKNGEPVQKLQGGNTRKEQLVGALEKAL
jgi:thioredoxin 1